VSKPQGYWQSAKEAAFYGLVFCLPCYRALLFDGLGRTIWALLLACLLMFLVVHSAEGCLLHFSDRTQSAQRRSSISASAANLLLVSPTDIRNVEPLRRSRLFSSLKWGPRPLPGEEKVCQ